MIRENSDSTLFKYAFDAYINNIFFFLGVGLVVHRLELLWKRSTQKVAAVAFEMRSS